MIKLIRLVNVLVCRVKFSTGSQELVTFDAGARGFSFGEEGISDHKM